MTSMVRTVLRGIAWKSWLLLAGWLVCSYNTGNPANPAIIHTLYNKATRLFNASNPSSTTDSLALAAYQQVIELSQRSTVAPDSLLFFALVNKGILLDVRLQYKAALSAYLEARRIRQRNPGWSDSLLYEVTEHIGSAYYHLNNFDSASYFLLQAEALAQRYPAIPQQERLYNDLGVLYYENGNFLQSRNYLTHALELLNNNPAKDADWVVNIENNIAACSYKLGLYEQAIAIYKTICAQNVFTSQISLNMGLAYKAMGHYQQALHWFHQVNYTTLPRVFNELAHTQLLCNQTDSATYYFARYQQMARAGKVQPNSIYFGMHHLYHGEQLVRGQQWQPALQAFQQAINIFSGSFTNPDPFTNPTQFTGTFTSYRLFNALYKKANTFDTLYQLQHNEQHLQAALATYNSAISLLHYIEKSYDTDEAKLFLKNNSQQVCQKAAAICLQLHTLHPDTGYAQQAFLIAERNKASVMYSGIKAKGFRKLPGIDAALIQQERNIKYNLARLSIRSDQAPDSATQKALAKERAGYEIQLAQLQHAIEQHSEYYQLKYSDQFPGADSLQQNLTARQAVISFYVTGNTLNLFVVTQDGFQHTQLDSFASIQNNSYQWLATLHNPENGRRFKGASAEQQLYRQLVQPMQALAGNKPEWIIVPDAILYHLPFEALPAEAGADAPPLLEHREISYQFSTRFIASQAATAAPLPAAYTTLAMAPFAQQSSAFPHAVYNTLQQLPASAKEIAGIPGRAFTGAQATKERFLQHQQQYPVVHLATHAIADTGNSTASFIAFYPNDQQQGHAALYLEELYDLNMEATQLVVLSACETGNGQLVNNEGVLSLTRGFAYAGCASMVNSLWKADDAATAAILHQFHTYLQQGYTKSKALRQAKLHYLHSNALHKAPGYWAHLILTGDNRPLVKAAAKNEWILPIGALGIAALMVGVILYKRRKKST